jgi:hypothetical protein
MKLGKKEHFSHWEWGRHSAPKTQSENPYMICLFSSYYCQENTLYWVLTIFSRPYTGAGSGGAHPTRARPLKLEKIWFFGVKSWFFTRNTSKMFALPSAIEKIWFFGVKSWFFTRNIPKIFAPPSARRNFFKCAPPNLKSWIRPCYILYILYIFTITYS